MLWRRALVEERQVKAAEGMMGTRRVSMTSIFCAALQSVFALSGKTLNAALDCKSRYNSVERMSILQEWFDCGLGNLPS